MPDHHRVNVRDFTDAKRATWRHPPPKPAVPMCTLTGYIWHSRPVFRLMMGWEWFRPDRDLPTSAIHVIRSRESEGLSSDDDSRGQRHAAEDVAPNRARVALWVLALAGAPDLFTCRDHETNWSDAVEVMVRLRPWTLLVTVLWGGLCLHSSSTQACRGISHAVTLHLI